MNNFTPRQKQTYGPLIEQAEGDERAAIIRGLKQYLSKSTEKRLNDFEPQVLCIAWRMLTEERRAPLTRICEEILEWRGKKTSSQELSRIFRVHGVFTKKANYGLTVTSTPEAIEKILTRMGFDTSQLSSLLTPKNNFPGGL